jgi:hypothetical protein
VPGGDGQDAADLSTAQAGVHPIVDVDVSDVVVDVELLVDVESCSRRTACCF